MICRVFLLVSALIFSLGFSAVAFAAEKLPSGFIAKADAKMPWAEAKTFCEQKGGKLPRMDNSDSLPHDHKVKQVENFGAPDSKMPAGLPGGYYWSGTEDSKRPGPDKGGPTVDERTGFAWGIDGRGGYFSVNTYRKNRANAVVCVPK